MTCDKHHLMWIRDRLTKVYKESPFFDYMHRLQKIIDGQKVCCEHSPCELYYEYKPPDPPAAPEGRNDGK